LALASGCGRDFFGGFLWWTWDWKPFFSMKAWGPICSASELPLLQTPQLALYTTSFGSHDWAQTDETQCGVAAWPHEAVDNSTRLVENLDFYPQEIATFPAFSIAGRAFGPLA